MEEAFRMIDMAMTITKAIMPRISRPMAELMRNVNAIPSAHMMGTGSTIWINMTNACWIVLISLMVRVTMEAVPNRSKSSEENVRVLS